MLYLFQKPCMTSQIFVEVKKLYCGFIWLPSNLPIMIISPRKFKFYCLNSFTSSSHAFKPGCLLTILIRNIVNYSHDLPLYKPYRCLNCTLHYNCIHFNSALATFSHHIVERDNNFIWSIIPGQVLLLIPPIDGCCLVQFESLHTVILSLQNYIDCSKCKKCIEMQCCSTAEFISSDHCLLVEEKNLSLNDTEQNRWGKSYLNTSSILALISSTEHLPSTQFCPTY